MYLPQNIKKCHNITLSALMFDLQQSAIATRLIPNSGVPRQYEDTCSGEQTNAWNPLLMEFYDEYDHSDWNAIQIFVSQPLPT